jgi:hypothetical protein
MLHETTMPRQSTEGPAPRESRMVAVMRSREAAELLWLAVCRSVSADHQRQPAFIHRITH